MQEWRQKILEQNDGSQPAEPGQRCSQIIFEAWMKQKCLEQPSIDGRFGWIYQSAVEDDSGVTSFFIDLEGQTYTVRSKYLIGCDGGGSKVRRGAGIRMIGGYLQVDTFQILLLIQLTTRKAIRNVSSTFQI